MEWILIVFGILLVALLVVWVKQSPTQKKIANLRKIARESGLFVRRCRRPDAREDERKLTSVCYEMPCAYKELDMTFCLQRVSERGEPSTWNTWRWAGKKPSTKWTEVIHYLITSSSRDVKALFAVRPIIIKTNTVLLFKICLFLSCVKLSKRIIGIFEISKFDLRRSMALSLSPWS